MFESEGESVVFVYYSQAYVDYLLFCIYCTFVFIIRHFKFYVIKYYTKKFIIFHFFNRINRTFYKGTKINKKRNGSEIIILTKKIIYTLCINWYNFNSTLFFPRQTISVMAAVYVAHLRAYWVIGLVMRCDDAIKFKDIFFTFTKLSPLKIQQDQFVL